MKLRFLVLALLTLAVVASAPPPDAHAGTCRDPINAPAEVQLGDRLFRETRFAQFFFAFLQAHPKRTVNTLLRPGDPTLKFEQNAAGKPIRDPFRNKSMNCRNCHLGNDLLGASRFEGRTYCDFAARSPIPARADGLSTTPRNAQSLVSVTIPREVPTVFHFDGEFADITDLTISTMAGRNFGWLPSEFATAVQHIVNVIRNDNGKNALARRYGCGGFPYRVVLLGADPRLPARLVLPDQYRLDVTTASDQDILNDVGALIVAYLGSIAFNLDEPPSPYDVFLAKNQLPTAPDPDETDLAYSQRLLGLVEALNDPQFVSQPTDGTLRLHKGQKFQFGPQELQGLKVFLTEAHAPVAAGAGNCVACHTPPAFTDNIFHNTGVSQAEYEALYGPGSFAALAIPDAETRNANFDMYLPPTPTHPDAGARFRSPASFAHPGFTDLGVWNIFDNPDIPNPQSALTQILCTEFNLSESACTPDAVLPIAIAFFKTPSLRDLGQSSPYFHNGSQPSIGDVMQFYALVSQQARSGLIRNASPELLNVSISAEDQVTVAAFINSLNEDYK